MHFLSIKTMKNVFTFFLGVKRNEWHGALWNNVLIEAEGGDFPKILTSLEQFVKTVKGLNNFL